MVNRARRARSELARRARRILLQDLTPPLTLTVTVEHAGGGADVRKSIAIDRSGTSERRVTPDSHALGSPRAAACKRAGVNASINT